MIDLVFKSYELLTVLLPFIIVFAVLNKIDKKNNRQNSLRHFLMLCVFAVYIFSTFHFTGAGTIFDIFRNITKQQYSGRINLVPFSDDIVPYLLNILLFVPFGFLLPLLWPNTGKFKYVLLSALCFSFLIEMSQFFSYRLTDIDDLVANTTGALLGYLVYRLFAHITKWKHKRLDYLKYEPLIYIGAMFLGHFLLYNTLGLRTILFGFRFERL